MDPRAHKNEELVWTITHDRTQMAHTVSLSRERCWCTRHGGSLPATSTQLAKTQERQWMVSTHPPTFHTVRAKRPSRIETLLEEAYNERMHLLTFMQMAKPGWFMKMMILGAQGVFYNGFFLAYLMSPRICHRFVGYLEEEAVLTYTRVIVDLDAGRLPKWQKLAAPEIAVKYWNMPEGHRSMRDMLLYIRADEAKHREVNHTLGNLEQTIDPNPFVSEYEDSGKPHPSKGIENIKPTGWDRKEVI